VFSITHRAITQLIIANVNKNEQKEMTVARVTHIYNQKGLELTLFKTEEEGKISASGLKPSTRDKNDLL